MGNNIPEQDLAKEAGVAPVYERVVGWLFNESGTSAFAGPAFGISQNAAAVLNKLDSLAPRN